MPESKVSSTRRVNLDLVEYEHVTAGVGVGDANAKELPGMQPTSGQEGGWHAKRGEVHEPAPLEASQDDGV